MGEFFSDSQSINSLLQAGSLFFDYQGKIFAEQGKKKKEQGRGSGEQGSLNPLQYDSADDLVACPKDSLSTQAVIEAKCSEWPF
ncbi:MAG: hypothetical protein KJO30_02565 [Boseongicola sp.]|nr:hypothetical protein [Boseongicola sp.]